MEYNMTLDKRKNFHQFDNPRKAAKDYLELAKKNGHKFVVWEKTAHGIVLCVGADYEDAVRNDVRGTRYVAINNDADLVELFTHFEDDE